MAGKELSQGGFLPMPTPLASGRTLSILLSLTIVEKKNESNIDYALNTNMTSIMTCF